MKPESEDRNVFLEIIIVTFKRVNALRCLVASFACQTDLGFVLRIIHDGADFETQECFQELRKIYPKLQLFYEHTEKHFNDYGNSLRNLGLMQAVQEYCLLTNDDNYYVPVFVENVRKTIEREHPEIIYFDMVHNYTFPDLPNPIGYQTLLTEPRIYRIDIGSFVFRTELGKSIGFSHNGPTADGKFFEDIAARTSRISKISKVLFVHN